MKSQLALGLALMFAAALPAAEITDARLDAAAAAIKDKVIEWRRHIHEHPELGNREFQTAEYVADHLRKLGMEVKTGIAHTGVAGVLRGGRPGPVIGIRSELDALPVTEQGDLPFKSVATSEYNGAKVGVMHACGHDSHMAMLMGLAEIMAGMREDLPGTVLFILQPAEEGAPVGEKGGASLMLKDGVFDIVKPEAVFSMHVLSQINAGKIEYRIGPQLAASDSFTINVTGVQSHGAAPWAGVDPIVASSQIVLALQTIVSRQANLTIQPAVLSIGSIQGGNRNNIIPDKVKMLGTLRTYDAAMREDIIKGMKRIIENVAAASGAHAELVFESTGNPVTINDARLTPLAVKSMQRAVGENNVSVGPLLTFSEDFSYFAAAVPGVMVEVGCTPPDQDASKAPANHSPLFFVDESAMNTGLRAMLYATTDYLKSGGTAAH